MYAHGALEWRQAMLRKVRRRRLQSFEPRTEFVQTRPDVLQLLEFSAASGIVGEKGIQFGAQINTQQVRVYVAGIDYLTEYADWLGRQSGAPFGPRQYDPTRRYLRSIRDLAAWVDADPPLPRK